MCTIIYGQQQCVREYMCNKNVHENIQATLMRTRVYGQQQCIREYRSSNKMYENKRATAMCTRLYHVHENIQTTMRYNNKRYVDIRICFTQCGRDQ